MTKRATAAALALLLLAAASPAADDPLAEAVAEWSGRLASTPGANDDIRAARAAAAPELAAAAAALEADRRDLALAHLAAIWPDLVAAERSASLPAAERESLAALRAGRRELAARLARPLPDLSVLPAAARAIAESALAESRAYLDASVPYGEQTAPEYGRYYLETAQAQRQLAELAASLPPLPRGAAALTPRSVAPELEMLEAELLAAYVPPASIERHRGFIAVAAELKRARELDEKGARFGALYRLLETRLALSRLLLPGSETAEEASVPERALRARIESLGSDSSLARLYLDRGIPDGSDGPPAAILTDVLPLYLAALGPAPPRPPDPEPEATVTLVRWPYT